MITRLGWYDPNDALIPVHLPIYIGLLYMLAYYPPKTWWNWACFARKTVALVDRPISSNNSDCFNEPVWREVQKTCMYVLLKCISWHKKWLYHKMMSYVQRTFFHVEKFKMSDACISDLLWMKGWFLSLRRFVRFKRFQNVWLMSRIILILP